MKLSIGITEHDFPNMTDAQERELSAEIRRYIGEPEPETPNWMVWVFVVIVLLAIFTHNNGFDPK